MLIWEKITMFWSTGMRIIFLKRKVSFGGHQKKKSGSPLYQMPNEDCEMVTTLHINHMFLLDVHDFDESIEEKPRDFDKSFVQGPKIIDLLLRISSCP